ncbi:MAG: M48 family metalloprotease [Natronomonas sp.]
MGRLSLRLLTALVGLGLLAFYGAVALAALAFGILLFEHRPSPLRIALTFLVVTLLFGYLSYRLGTAGLLAELDTKRLRTENVPWFQERLESLADGFGIDPPEVHVADLGEPNAFAIETGDGGVVVIDPTLLALLTVDELEAIVAHELAHLAARDGLTQTVGFTAIQTASGLLYLLLFPVGLVVFGIRQALSLLRGNPIQPLGAHLRSVRYAVASAVVFLFFVLTLALRAHSRRREFAADDRAVDVTNNPIALARALIKIERAVGGGFDPLSPLYTHGSAEESLSRLLATHPPVSDRIDRLLRRDEQMWRRSLRNSDGGR